MSATPATVTTGGPAPAPWGFWATLGWAVLAVLLGQSVGTLVLLLWFDPAAVMALRYDGPTVALATLVINPVQIAVLAAVARRAGWQPGDYFGWRSYRGGDFVHGFVAVAALAGAIALYALATGRDLVTPFQVETYTTAPNAVWLVLLALAIVVVAPLGEELVFRGFVFRGWVRAGRNPAVAIVAISLLWTALHVQYDWFGLAQVFLLGLVFGWVRWKSGSTALTFVLHALVNFESGIETVVKVGF